ncbi:ATPase, T2SS/T4P/T4SS family [Pseudomonas syringae]|uniref:ATPase, T2SS/T4P/T4SS family n=1 Tax=Pseudomonas syringae TaxID=317 RepID=UPI001F1EF5CA|nr:ATPase, T2SS/T4P/T4SS family [Pseudomonas syringae]MCF5371286.1 twitching motility protein [Pseudomonas syringae]MCF5382117.1 twitching motility protein [Pseudomonas syringae]MCF5422946.1 twitching motility protein [Pseudomonas syringae]MCF5455019.1 twitching motility protein [Pseudomonas syringae]MCF5458270.1 twitching motility protein [Pseudomonas syringae]
MDVDQYSTGYSEAEKLEAALRRASNVFVTGTGFVDTSDDFGVVLRGSAPKLWNDFFQTNYAQKARGSQTKASHYTTEFLGHRYRCCLANSAKGWGISMRRLANKIPSLRDDLSLDWNIIQPLMFGSGLTLFAGRMGCGKSTTMAASIGMLDDRNAQIATVEDPIEVLYPSETILQREVGTHVESFAEAIKDCVRQNRTTIVVSEIRDAETANAALLAASTGHSVLATIHADNVFDIYTRMLSLVDQRYERVLARNLRGLWWQQVVRFGDTKRKPIPIYESLVVDNEARLILDGGPSKLQMLGNVMDRQGRKEAAHVAMLAVSQGKASKEEMSEFLLKRTRLNMD